MKISTSGVSCDFHWWQIPGVIASIPRLINHTWIRKYPYRGRMLSLNQIAKIEYPLATRPFRAAFEWSDRNHLIGYVLMSGQLPPNTRSIEELLGPIDFKNSHTRKPAKGTAMIRDGKTRKE